MIDNQNEVDYSQPEQTSNSNSPEISQGDNFVELTPTELGDIGSNEQKGMAEAQKNLQTEFNNQPENQESVEINPDKKETVEDIKKRLLVRDMPKEYGWMIKINNLINMSDSYVRHILPQLELDRESYEKQLSDEKEYDLKHEERSFEAEKYIETKFNNQTVLDLGCGEGNALPLAKKFKAKEYIGVDLYARNPRFIKIKGLSTVSEKIQNEEFQETNDEKIIDNNDGIFFQGDMLNLISRLADNSVGVIVIAGLQPAVEWQSEYFQAFEKAITSEIKRVLKKDGVIVNCSAYVGPEPERRDKEFKAVAFQPFSQLTCTHFIERKESEGNKS